MKIGHCAIWCQDIERLREFYQRYFSAKPNDKYINPSKKFSSYFLSFDSGARLELMQMESVKDSLHEQGESYIGYAHLAFVLSSRKQVDRLTDELKRDGFHVLDGPRQTGDGYYESTVLDPEGNRIEITA